MSDELPYKVNTYDELMDEHWKGLDDDGRCKALEKLLADNSFGRLKNLDGELYELSRGQITTATALMNKYKADLKSVEHKGEVNLNYDAAVLALLAGRKE